MMTNGELAFMALAEELNFTRAAEKIYMSQQGLSDHVRRLEKEYNTTLVTRKPEVALTETGHELYRMLLSKQSMEYDVRRMITDIDQGDVGEVRVGISSARVRAFTSDIVQEFYYKHPRVRVRIVCELTSVLVQMLQQGELDFVIGVNPEPGKDILVEPLFEDPLYVAVPEHIARERTGDADRVDLRLYQDVPFIRDLHDSATVNVIDNFLAQQNIILNNVIAINDYNEQAALCSRLDGAMFCSKSFAFFKGGEIMRKGLRILGIKGLQHSVTICLITAKPRVYPKCVREFMDITKDSLQQFYEDNIAEKSL